MQKKGRMDRLAELKKEQRTVIFYEAPHKLLRTLEDFLETFGADRKISLCRELTKVFEEVYRTSVGEALKKYQETPPKGEFVLILEGASEEAEPVSWADITVEAHVEMYEKNGMSRMDAVKQVARDRNVPKREIYDAVMR